LSIRGLQRRSQPGSFDELNNEELRDAIIQQTRELVEVDPEFAEFAKQLVQQTKTKH
jgi:hypothetical protein